MKRLLLATTLLFSSLSYASGIDATSLSGFRDEKRLSIEVNNICLSPSTRLWGAGPYYISAQVFSELLFTENDYSRRKEPYSRSHKIRSFESFYKINDFENTQEGSTSFNRLFPNKVNFKDIKDLNFDIPMRDINFTLLEAAEPFETESSFFPEPSQIGPKAIRIVGVEIGVFSGADGTKVFSSKTAFMNPNKYIGSDLRKVSTRAFNGRTPTLYPRMSFLHKSPQTVQLVDKVHTLSPVTHFECDGESGLDLTLEVL